MNSRHSSFFKFSIFSLSVVFIVERMSKDAVRLKGEAANKYICITKKQKIITKVSCQHNPLIP